MTTEHLAIEAGCAEAFASNIGRWNPDSDRAQVSARWATAPVDR